MSKPQLLVLAVLAIVVIGVGVFLYRGGSSLGMSQRVEFVGAATTTVYTLSGTTLSFVSAAPTKNHVLGTLPDGSLLELTPIGLSQVMADGTAVQLINAGGAGSTTPIGVASSDLSVVAFENMTIHRIVVYRFNPASQTSTFIGSASLGAAIPKSVGLTGQALMVNSSDGAYYSLPILGDSVGAPIKLTLITR